MIQSAFKHTLCSYFVATGADEDSSLCSFFLQLCLRNYRVWIFSWQSSISRYHPWTHLLRCLHRCHPVPVRDLSHALVYSEKAPLLPPGCLQPFDMQIKGRSFLSILRLVVHVFYYLNSFDTVLTTYLSISPAIYSILSFFCPQAFGQQQQWETWYQLSSEED